MKEPPFKERHCLICSQLSIQVGELSPTKWDLWAISADRRHALPWTQSPEESSLHCVPCGCCSVRMLYPPGLNTLQAATSHTAANRPTEAPRVSHTDPVSSDRITLLRSGVNIFYLKSPNIQEFASIQGRGMLLLSNSNESYPKSASRCG